MSYHTLNTALNVLYIIVGLLSLYGLYFVIMGIIGLKKNRHYDEAEPQTKFAVIIPARNEEAVVGHLIDSLNHQDYPKELYTVFCAPNNCSDDTAGVALAHGAELFIPKGKITSKGQVLSQFVDKIMSENEYDYICVFDADNLANPDFLQKMNNAAVSGVQVGEGYRDSKNPTDSAISTCSSIGYWMLDRFYNNSREQMGLSSLVHGCGFIASVDLLRRLGGWHTMTITEDYEFSAQCVLSGVNVRYVPEAIFFDEQPLHFSQSWKQQRRWSTGYIQGMGLYLNALLKKGIKEKNKSCIDLAITFIQPVINVASIITSIVITILGAYKIVEFNLMPLTKALIPMVLFTAASILFLTLIAYITIKLNLGSKMKGTLKGIAYFAFFIASRAVIGIISVFKKQTKWEAIAHSRAVSVKEIK